MNHRGVGLRLLQAFTGLKMWKLVICLLPCIIASAWSEYTYNTYYYQQRVDHFDFSNQDTYAQRYLIADQNWAVGSGPIFFYTGNEGDIELFAENTGFMWEIAPEFQALLIFAEHRYYGKSMPYGNSSLEIIKYLGYLSSEQALADFTELISVLKSNISGAANVPVIAFGGSYGGMLAAWGRMKYPHIYLGAIAASAPIFQFTGLTPCGTFNQIVTKSFRSASPTCSENIRSSWNALTNISKTDDGLEWLSTTLQLCQPLVNQSDIQDVKDFLTNMYGNLAMVNYPYPANFLAPLPAWPVKAGCSYLNDSHSSDKELITALADLINLYNNYTGNISCLDTSQQGPSSLGDDGWDFQACTEMVMPMCSNGETDMFEPVPWNFQEFSDSCFEKYNTSSQEYMAERIYGGRDISAASNIVFSNGQLDPWSGGGVLESISDTLVAVLIRDGAHHLDLRAANAADPPSVIKARELEKSYIRQWIASANSSASDTRSRDDHEFLYNISNMWISFLTFVTITVLCYLFTIILGPGEDIKCDMHQIIPSSVKTMHLCLRKRARKILLCDVYDDKMGNGDSEETIKMANNILSKTDTHLRKENVTIH